MGIYERLGVKRMIGAAGTGTGHGGSIMPTRVKEAMEEASTSLVDLTHLLEQAGRRIADLAGVEAAYVTSGAAGGVTLATAACMTGSDVSRVHQLPNTNGMKSEAILQVMQRNYYELMVRLAGATTVEVGLANRTESWHIESAINENTAAVAHFVAYASPKDLPIAQVVEIAHRHDVPVIVDAANELPPFSGLRKWWDMGVDLTIFSGGKGLRGPQSSGLILGRQDLIDACAANANPIHGVGRPMKVSKEVIAGIVTAVELWSVEEFEQAEMRRFEEQVAFVNEELSKLPGVTTVRGEATSPPGLPEANVEWDFEAICKPESTEGHRWTA